MYRVYIRNFTAPSDWPNAGQEVTQEHLIYSLPMEFPEEEILVDPKVKTEMGKAGSFEFSMEQGSPFYSSLRQMKTLMRVKYDDTTIFYGRVLSIDNDMWGKRKVHCEGALAFLLDTLIIATKEEERKKISLEEYVKSLIDSHNNLVTDEPSKKFYYGQIPGYYSSSIPAVMRPVGETRKFGSGSWTSTMNCLEDLTSKYGGYWRARYEESNDRLYLDWFLNMFDPVVNTQPLRVTENIIDINNTVDVNGIFTVLIPEGTKNGKPLYLDDIPKTVTKTKRKKKKKETIGPGYKGGNTDFPTGTTT